MTTLQFYRRQIEGIQLFMRGCIWYGLLILMSYQDYLSGGKFRPFFSMLLLPCMLVLWFLRIYIKNTKWKLAVLLLLPVLFLYLTGLPWFFLIVEAVLQVSHEYFKEDSVQRFGVFWETWFYKIPGILLLLLILILHEFWTDGNPLELVYGPRYAGGFILAAWILFLILYMINNYMQSFYRHFSHRFGAIQKEAFQRAKRSNYAMMVIIGICGIVTMFLFTFVPMSFYRKLLSALKLLLGRILGLVLPEFEEYDFGTAQVEDLETLEIEPIHGGKLYIGSDGKIFSAILAVGLVALLIWVIVKIYKGFLVRYQVETDTAEFVSPREVEEKVYQEKRKGFFVRFGNSNRDKIRKIYYQTIMKRYSRLSKERKEKITNTQTPSDWSHLLSTTPEGKKALAGLTVYYEKARFGREECKDEDVEMAKKLSL